MWGFKLKLLLINFAGPCHRIHALRGVGGRWGWWRWGDLLIFNQAETHSWFTDPRPCTARAKCHIPIWMSRVSGDKPPGGIKERQSCVPNDKCPFCWGVLSIGGGDGDKPRLRALIGHLLFMSRALLAVHFCPRNSVAAFLSSPARPSASLQKCDNPLRLPSTSIYYLYAGRFCLFKQEGHSWNNKSSRSSRCVFFFFLYAERRASVFLCVGEKNLNVNTTKYW